MTWKGNKDRRITIKRPIEGAADGFNVTPVTLAIYAVVYASKADTTDRERLAAAENRASIDTRFTVGWNSITRDIRPTDIVVYGGREYGIAGLKEVGRQAEIEISCTARSEGALP